MDIAHTAYDMTEETPLNVGLEGMVGGAIVSRGRASEIFNR